MQKLLVIVFSCLVFIAACQKDKCADRVGIAPVPVVFRLVDQQGKNLITLEDQGLRLYYFEEGIRKDLEVSISEDSKFGYMLKSGTMTMVSAKITKRFYLQQDTDVDTLFVDARSTDAPCGTVGGSFKVEKLIFNGRLVSKVNDDSWGHYTLVKSKEAVIGSGE